MYHDKAYRVEKTNRVINRRFNIIKKSFPGASRVFAWSPPRNKLNKYNLACGCRMCRKHNEEDKYHRNIVKKEERKEISSYNDY